MKKKIVIIDGQGGKIGCSVIEQLKARKLDCDIYAIGTNSIAASAMLKAGADFGASGENPVVVNCRDADLIVGPIGIVLADSLMGEVTPAIAVAVGQSPAQKLLLPINRCGCRIVGIGDLTVPELIERAVTGICNAL